MSELGERLADDLESLKTIRDELRVKIHLGKMEAQDQWQRAEKSWHELEDKLREIERESREPLHDVAEAARNLAREIGEAYKRIRSLL